MQALEQQLGLTLFRREGRQVQLTDVGRLYQRELSEALGRIRRLVGSNLLVGLALVAIAAARPTF